MLSDRIAALAADRVSGASGILTGAIAILRDALAGEADVTDTARSLVRAQPSMAPVWNAALAALAGPPQFEAFASRVQGSPTALTRHALELFGAAPRHVITLSYSGTVAAILEALADRARMRVTCAESAPAMEGRALAARLAAAGVAVTCTHDDKINGSVRSADAVMVGADAVTPEWFLNKAGTRSLAAAAAASRVPLYLAASRDKFAGAAVAARLAHNPLFESTRLANVTAVITDGGVLEASMVRRVCQALDLEWPQSLTLLAGTFRDG
jgi:translation initiation factor 2B subunit (eIF-2B alpha/beta/delta family)